MKKWLMHLLLFAATTGLLAQEPDYLNGLPHYQPQQMVSGTIRNWGNNYIPSLMQKWEDGFRRQQPGVRFETKLKGTEASMAGLYGGIADLAFIGREAYQPEIGAFRERFGYDPFGVEISSGSFNTPHKTFALMVYVHKGNPLEGLTIQQLAAIFGCGGPNGKKILTWGDVGLKGAWAQRPIHPYGYAIGTGMAAYFDRAVLQGSGRWSNSLSVFDNGRQPNGDVINAGVYVLQALQYDPDGIAYANPLYQNDDVRVVPLAYKTGEPFVEPTKYTTWTRNYPLTRFTMVYMNRPPGGPLDPKLREFIRYILSWEGMRAVVEDGAYLPLNKQVIEEQLRKLDSLIGCRGSSPTGEDCGET
jgi:phosphate transport system substrate-binding protein